MNGIRFKMTYAVILERPEASAKTTLGVKVGKEEIEAGDEDEACYDGPFYYVASL